MRNVVKLSTFNIQHRTAKPGECAVNWMLVVECWLLNVCGHTPKWSSPYPPPKELRAKPRWKINYFRAGVRRSFVSNSNPLTPTLSPLWRGEEVGTIATTFR